MKTVMKARYADLEERKRALRDVAEATINDENFWNNVNAILSRGRLSQAWVQGLLWYAEGARTAILEGRQRPPIG